MEEAAPSRGEDLPTTTSTCRRQEQWYLNLSQMSRNLMLNEDKNRVNEPWCSTDSPEPKRRVSLKWAAVILTIFEKLPPEDQDLVERRLLPPWQRRARRRTRRDNAVRSLARIIQEERSVVSGRELGRLMAAACRRLPSPDDGVSGVNAFARSVLGASFDSAITVRSNTA
jgi:hypothetical protein